MKKQRGGIPYCFQLMHHFYRPSSFSFINKLLFMGKQKQFQKDQPQKSKKQRKRQKILRKKQQKQQRQASEQEQQNIDINKQHQQHSDDIDELDLFQDVQQNQQILNVEFLISQISQKHYHSMKTILEKLAKNSGVLSSEWADAIIKNKQYGNLVDIEQDDDEQEDNEQEDNEQEDNNEVDDQQNMCHGLINILPLYKPQIKGIKNKIWSNIQKSHQSRKKQRTIISNLQKLPQQMQTKSFFLVNQRAINLPPFVVVNMHKVLVNDIKNLIKNPKNYYVIGMSQIERVNQNQHPIDIDKIIFTKFQDYEFIKNSQESWLGQTIPSPYRKNDMQLLFFVMKLNKYYQIVEKNLQQMLVQ